MVFGNKNRQSAQTAPSKDPFSSLSPEAKESRRLHILLETSKKLNSSRDLESLLKDAVDSAVEVTGAERGFLMLLDEIPQQGGPQESRMEFRVARTAAKNDLPEASFKISMTIARQVSQTGDPVWIRDVQQDRALKGSESASNLDLRSILCAALKLEKKILGVLYVDSRFILRSFTQEDSILFEALSEYASVAIGKSLLYQDSTLKAKFELENQELKTLDRKKSDFINMLSHEFRTPLTVIQGYSERLKSGRVTDPAQVLNHSLLIYEEAKRLSRMVDELLDIARLRSGQDKIERVECDVIEIIEKTIESLKPSMESKQIQIHTIFQKPSILMWLLPDKIHQLIFNLLDNAIKYTPEGGSIQIVADEIQTLEIRGDQSIESFAQVSVSDNGIGITSAERERIFDEFYRGTGAAHMKERGTGLGLSICREIVIGHGGRIWVESQHGKGSKFIFTLPNFQPREKSPKTAS